VEVTVENTGGKPTQNFYVTLQKDLGKKLSIIKVLQGETQLETKLDDETHDQIVYRSILKSPLKEGASVSLKVELVFTHAMTPFPEEITQSERQLVRYHDNHYWSSLYRTESVKTKIKLSSSSVQSTSELSPSSVKADVVTYGPYKDVAPFSFSLLSLHFENNRPFITVTHVLRWIEVSHWGNIAIEENYKLQHDGAKLKGSFSRYDFQINAQANGQAAVQVLRQLLPETAADVYYRDDIGNISTSNWRLGSPKQTMDMRPRFPLFGGWKTEFTIGYNLPTSPYLATSVSDPSHYILSIPFMADWESGIAVDRQVVKVVLPEGAKVTSVDAPFDVDVTYENLLTYLDVSTMGRTVAIISKNNLVNDHNVPIVVHYTFTKSMMLFEPFLLVAVYFAFFVIVIILLRVDLTISEESKAVALRVDDPATQAILEKLGEIYSARTSIHSSLEDYLNNYIKTNNEKVWEKERKNANKQLSDHRKWVMSSNSELGAYPDILQKVNDIERKQLEKESIQVQLHEILIKYKVKKAITKTEHEDGRERLKKQYEAKEEEINNDVVELFGAF